MRRVVVTGMGMVTPLGQGVDANWKNLLAGKSGISRIQSFDVSDITCQIAGLIPEKNDINGLNLDDFIDPKEQRKIDRFIQLGIVAAIEAVDDSNWEPKTVFHQERTGVMIGSGIGGLQTIVETTELMNERGPRRISPFFIPSALINLISGQVSIRFGFKGPNHSVVTACSTGAHAIGDAARIIAVDDADVMIAGGAEAAVCRLGMAGFAAARALCTKYNDSSEIASRPWDIGRDGFVLGEGAGVLVLEEYEHAKARGAKIYCEIPGFGMSADANHITAPCEDGEGAARCMNNAIKNAGISPNDINYVNAHGTSTPLGDIAETVAIKRMFAEQSKNIAVSSTKSSIGHLLGAAGGVEAVFTALAIRDQIAPPTINLHDQDPACDLDYVPNHARKMKINGAISNSFGFGGTNGSLVFTRI